MGIEAFRPLLKVGDRERKLLQRKVYWIHYLQMMNHFVLFFMNTNGYKWDAPKAQQLNKENNNEEVHIRLLVHLHPLLLLFFCWVLKMALILPLSVDVTSHFV